VTVGLYQQLIGASWEEVDATVRKAHLRAGVLQAKGTFRITRGQGYVACFLAWLLRLPPAARAVSVHLRIEAHEQGERWLRTFGCKRLRTTQRAGRHETLVEQFGILELRFRLVVTDSGIDYYQQGAALRRGRLILPLPHWMAPQVSASERAVVGTGLSTVLVTVTVPGVGLLIRYDGELQVVKAL
jgi:hypothetical protein